MKKIQITLILLLITWLPSAFAANVTVNLTVAYKTVNFTGKTVQAIAVNDQIPAPTLHFKEGDRVTINVYNHLDKGTIIHWHGLLVPWQMDGVEGISAPAIPPGGVFHYQFTLKQSGTYWYHAHAGFQEQQGLYGGIIIDPLQPPRYHYDKDFVIILSDWSNTSPEQIYRNLKKDGDFYSADFPLQPSLLRFIHDYRVANTMQRQTMIMNYKMMQQMRMSIYDISDVAYDTFLLNGQPPTQPWTALVKPGDVVRLRFIDAGSGTMFHVKIPGTTLQMVHVQGHDVQPYTVNDFTMTPAETYDALVKITNHSPYIIYAESADTVGAALGALITQPHQVVDYKNVAPFPTPQPDTGMSGDMSGMDMKNMDMSAMQPAPSKYQNLVSPVPTNDPNKPVQIIRMELSGYMGRFIWFINGVPGYKAKPILIEPGKRYRIIFVNKSMMHHPMHLHGHFFILRNGHGAFDPFLHTIDVAPGETVVADFDADASGQWIFHCHFLYHMMSGMERVFRYTTYSQNQTADSSHAEHADHMIHPANFYAANFLDASIDPFNNTDKFTYKALLGSDYNKLELYMNDAEIDNGKITNGDVDIFYWYPISEFWAIKGGVNYFYRPAQTPYWQPGVGIEGQMPYFIDTDIRNYWYSGSDKLDAELSRDSQISNNFFIRVGVRSIIASKTVAGAGIGNGFNEWQVTVRPYIRLSPNIALFTEYEHTRYYGALSNILQSEGGSATENLWSIGTSLLF